MHHRQGFVVQQQHQRPLISRLVPRYLFQREVRHDQKKIRKIINRRSRPAGQGHVFAKLTRWTRSREWWRTRERDTFLCWSCVVLLLLHDSVLTWIQLLSQRDDDLVFGSVAQLSSLVRHERVQCHRNFPIWRVHVDALESNQVPRPETGNLSTSFPFELKKRKETEQQQQVLVAIKRDWIDVIAVRTCNEMAQS